MALFSVGKSSTSRFKALTVSGTAEKTHTQIRLEQNASSKRVTSILTVTLVKQIDQLVSE